MSKPNILVSGLGGGLDIINASLLYFLAKNQDIQVVLGSTRPLPLSEIERHEPFAECGTLLNGKSKINKEKTSRYVEAQVAKILNDKVVYLSRQFDKKTDIPRLVQAVENLQAKFSFTDLIFLDGGGDSLVLSPKDASKGSETNDPYAGGDAETMDALFQVADKIKAKIYHAVISVGLDVVEEEFHKNVELLKKRNGYFGRINLKTGEKDLFQLDHLMIFEKVDLRSYFEFAEKILILDEKDYKDPSKTPSHTATVTYHALKGEYGIHRTFVRWEPKTDGKKGVEVKPSHCWMYFFDAKMVQELKLEITPRPHSKI